MTRAEFFSLLAQVRQAERRCAVADYELEILWSRLSNAVADVLPLAGPTVKP